MKKLVFGIISILGISALLAVIYQFTRVDFSTSQAEVIVAKTPTVTESKPLPNSISEVPANSGDSKSVIDTPTSREIKSLSLTKELQNMGRCLKLTNAKIPVDAVPSQISTVLEILTPDLGEISVDSEDSTESMIRTASGEIRTIRIELDFSDEDKIVRRLTYMRKSPQGLSELIALPEEQSVDPNPSFIASLEKEGRLIGSEKHRRYYFPQGEELSYTEKSTEETSHLGNFELNRNGKSFRCLSPDGEQFHCECL